MNRAYLMTEAYLKDASVVNENTNQKLINSTILLAQDKYIQPLLGSSLYRQIMDQIVAETVSAANKTLIDDYIQPAMVWFILLELPDNITFQFRNKGVMKRNSENSTAADTFDLTRLSDKASNNAEWYAQRMILFLCQNHDDYPLYDNPGTGIDIIFPKRNAYQTTMDLTDWFRAPRSAAEYYENFRFFNGW